MQIIRCYLIFLLFGLLLPACNYLDERPYTIYETTEEARMSGAIRRGWLPAWLPQSAFQIHEYHDLDTNARAFSFRTPSEEAFKLPIECQKAEQIQRPRLETKLFPKQIHKRADIQICGQVFIVVDQKGVVHGWAN